MLKYLINAISNAIGFTKTESKGSLVLIFIIICLLFSYQARVKYLKEQPVNLPDSLDMEWLAEVEASIKLKRDKQKEYKYKNKSSPKRYLGKAESDRKIKKKEVVPSKKILVEKKVSDLNVATAEDLQRVRGIGPAFSERIIKYRTLLGGFADTTQLHEVYGLQPEVIAALTTQFELLSPVQRINLNADSLKHLAKHPYISYDLARIILNYRLQHGDFTTAEDLKNIKIIDKDSFNRLRPYLE
ncbi:MAG: helix-hairpin-helix domain-containing protein [Ekhidna sp.]|nr:helix-hairpin-helix domain-containing protein [Ekhidna sp.]